MDCHTCHTPVRITALCLFFQVSQIRNSSVVNRRDPLRNKLSPGAFIAPKVVYAPFPTPTTHPPSLAFMSARASVTNHILLSPLWIFRMDIITYPCRNLNQIMLDKYATVCKLSWETYRLSCQVWTVYCTLVNCRRIRVVWILWLCHVIGLFYFWHAKLFSAKIKDVFHLTAYWRRRNLETYPKHQQSWWVPME